MEFQPFEKIARYQRELIITEKLDGTNAQIHILPMTELHASDMRCLAAHEGMVMFAGSRKRYICPENYTPAGGTDNFSFAWWVQMNARDLFTLGEGRHYGEWYGAGIQRGYGLEEKRFALFNVNRWGDHNPNTPSCCEVVTRITGEEGEFIFDVNEAMAMLEMYGSQHVYEDVEACNMQGKCTNRVRFMNPEGIVAYHTASRTLYKQTFGNDGGKWREDNLLAARTLDMVSEGGPA